MKCFSYFKDKTRAREQKSAPTLKTMSKSEVSEDTTKVTKSSCSVTSPRSMPEMYGHKVQNLRVFTFRELKQATNNFHRTLKIGEGGFGSVYKGAIKPAVGKGDPVTVAIKKLNTDGFQGHKQWVAEVQFLGVVEHPNLVKLIGYCASDGDRGIQRLLVYEYMPNKSFEDHLFVKSETLSWECRLQIALGAAQGLAYLHEELEIQVIYRDFKSSNVLLDDRFKPKLSDFGLAREGPSPGHTHVSTAVVGTYGYAAPDYMETWHLTAKSDVYSFGVVLFETLTGRRSLERDRPKSKQKLLEWVKNYPVDGRKFGMIMDPRFENQYSLGAARKVARLANSCLVKSPKDRPNMSQVVETLKQIVHQVLVVESPPSKYLEEAEEKPEKKLGDAESARRRMEHLANISEQAGGDSGVSRRKSVIMQRAKVTGKISFL